jgi:hypothetical protein
MEDVIRPSKWVGWGGTKDEVQFDTGEDYDWQRIGWQSGSD